MAAVVAAIVAFVVTGALLVRSTPRFKPYQLAPFVLPKLGSLSGADPATSSLPVLSPPASLPVLFDSRTPPRAGQAMVINFFFSTCPPCREELPVLRAASTNLPKSVTMIGIVHAEAEKTAVPFVREFGLTYDVLFDEQGSVAPNVGVVAFPTTLFIDSSGMVVKRHFGAISAEELQQGINQIAHAS